MGSKLSVAIVGMGYIGLPTAALIASKGIRVIGIDVCQDIVDTINRGAIHIVEPDLDQLVRDVVKKGMLKTDTKPQQADVYIIAVPTPFKEGHKPDLSYVESAVKSLSAVLSEGSLIIIESTSPVGTTEKMQRILYDLRPELKDKIHMAYCPERVLPGNIIYELEHNDRVIGGVDEISAQKAIAFYQCFVKGDLYETNSRTAELCKLVENSHRDVNIAFANELSMICDKAGINVWDLIRLANKHPRVRILQPGAGVGGHCIAVDPWFVVSEFPKEAKIIRAAREINDYKTEWVLEKIKARALKFELDNKNPPKIACMGLAFKPNIDDLRESPALYVTERLIQEGFAIMPVEPNLTEHDTLDLCTIEDAVSQADILIYLVAHKEFKNKIYEKEIIDFCNIN